MGLAKGTINMPVSTTGTFDTFRVDRSVPGKPALFENTRTTMSWLGGGVAGEEYAPHTVAAVSDQFWPTVKLSASSCPPGVELKPLIAAFGGCWLTRLLEHCARLTP